MTTVVNSTPTLDDEPTSHAMKRRRSSSIAPSETDIEQTPFKRVRSSSPTLNATNVNHNHMQSMFACLDDIVRSHRNLVREYVDLQMRDRPDLSIDEQRFIQAEEDLIEKAERNLHGSHQSAPTTPSRNGKRQRVQSINGSTSSFDRVKHETHILKRIDELKSDGKWTNQRLGKCLEPDKRKTHWDYLLDEMRWLAEDFALEKRWKQAMAKKVSLAVLKYFREKNQVNTLQQRDETKRLRQQAQFMCREVMNFWRNIYQIADCKQATRTQELRQHQLDIHLNLMIDQRVKCGDDGCQTTTCDEQSDDEETIEREERNEPDEYAANELNELRADQEASIDTVLQRHYGIDRLNEQEEGSPHECAQWEGEDNAGEMSDSISEEDETADNDPATVHQKINHLVTDARSSQPTGCTLDTTVVKTPVPFLLKQSLREYQHVGLDWLVTLYESHLNGILADAMGLGKTVQTIALLAHLSCEKGVWGPHLLIVPSDQILDWQLEFRKWCPALKVSTYSGAAHEHPSWPNANVFHTCLTSYQYVLRHIQSFRRQRWHYLILDEAQSMKNVDDEQWQALFHLRSERRLLLTSESLPNSRNELCSKAQFLMPHLFTSHEDVDRCFSNLPAETHEQEAIEDAEDSVKQLHEAVRSFTICRSSKDVNSQMPKEEEHVVVCHLSKRQQELYEGVSQCKSTHDILQHGHCLSVLNILMQLRKICNHPDLFQSRPVRSPLVLGNASIKCVVPKMIVDVQLKNPYLSLDSSSNETFLCSRIKFSLRATKEMILDSVHRQQRNHHERARVSLTKEIIERYRNSSVWNPTHRMARNVKSHSGMQRNVSTGENDQDLQLADDSNEIHPTNGEERLSRLERLCRINADRCQTLPFYGSDLLSQIRLAMRPCRRDNRSTFSAYASCQQLADEMLPTTARDYLSISVTLRALIQLNSDMLDEEGPTFDRFLMCVTRVLAFPMELCRLNGIRLTDQSASSKPLIEVLSSHDRQLLSDRLPQPILLEFPDRRLVQHDCGKLQALDMILSDLKRDQHRCLLFTPMNEMLDILESFLNYRGYTYVRLDTGTDMVQQQMLIEQFNGDETILACILSTRTRQAGVHLTGADTIILYDTDWNPTMDAQVQDRCHRLVQSKDIHTYRLITQSTVEGNLLQKNNGKFLLGDLTIDGDGFERTYFKKSQVSDLFDRSVSTQDIVRQRNGAPRMMDSSGSTHAYPLNLVPYEEALASVEDELDRQAATECRNELLAKRQRCNDNDDDDDDQLIEERENQMNSVAEELETLDKQLQPIERYALRYIEAYRTEYHFTGVDSNTYIDPEQLRKDWQWSRSQAAMEEEEKQADDDLIYTYVRDNEPKIWVTEDGQAFEVWSGILMRYSADFGEEIYHEDALDCGYESEAMIIDPEEYIRFPLPKALTDATNMSKLDTNILVPRSLFDRSNLLLNTQSSSLSTNSLNKSKVTLTNNKILPPTVATPPTNIKARQLYVNNGTTTTPLPNSPSTNVVVPASSSSRPMKLEDMLSKDNFQGLLEIDNSDWLISEDFKVLDTIQNIQQLPLSSISFSSTSNANKPQSMLPNAALSSSSLLPSTSALASSPSSSSIVNNTTNALTQNWDFVSDIVNRYSRILRTPKQCKHRFEQVIGPREEGRVVYDLVKKKKHIIKGTVKLSDDNWQMLRTNQLFGHDNCQKLLQIYHQKFETIAQCEQKTAPVGYLNKFKQMQIAQAAHHQMRGLKLGSLLQENNINFDKPLAPGDVSYQRSEREKESKLQQQQQQQQLQLQQQQQSAQAVTANILPQQQTPTPTVLNSVDAIKAQAPSANPTLASTIPARVRPASVNAVAASNNPSISSPTSLLPAPTPSIPPTIQRSASNNIIVSSNNHSNMTPTRTQTNTIPTRPPISSSTSAPINANQVSVPTATILPGQRPAQVLPSNHMSTNESNIVPQKQVGTVQISSSDYRQVRAMPSQQPAATTIPTPTTNQLQTPSNFQVRAQHYARSPVPATLDIRSQLPPSPKSQAQQQPSTAKPLPNNTRTASVTPAQVDHLIQSQVKPLTASVSQSSAPVAVVRPIQTSSASMGPNIVSSPTSPLNPSSLTVTLPPSKLTTSTSTSNATTNPPQQLRTTTAFLPNSSASTSLPQTVPQQIRHLINAASNSSFSNQQAINTQRLTEAAQRSPSSIQQIIAARTASLPGQVRNVRIVTFTPGMNAATGIADTTTTTTTTSTPPTSAPQASIQTNSITFNRSNSSTSPFARSTINIDQDISPDLAAQLHRIKSLNSPLTDPNDPSHTPRAVLVPARTISGSSSAIQTSAVGSTPKVKSSSSLDPTTLSLTTKPSQGSIVFQLPPSTSIAGGDEQSGTNSPSLTRQNLLQHLNFISSNINPRPQSPTTTTIPGTHNPSAVSRLLQQYQQIRAAAAAAAAAAAPGTTPATPTTSLSAQLNNEQASSSPPPPAPPSSAT